MDGAQAATCTWVMGMRMCGALGTWHGVGRKGKRAQVCLRDTHCFIVETI